MTTLALDRRRSCRRLKTLTSRTGDPYARECVVRLLNLVEKLAIELRTLQEENQRLQDENARLKGEKGKPDIKANGRSRPLLRSMGFAGRASKVMGRQRNLSSHAASYQRRWTDMRGR